MSSPIPWPELKIEKQIGSGAVGLVFKGFYHGSPVAIKRLSTELLDKASRKAKRSDFKRVTIH